MRLWSLHPGYLDPQGLVALWREALLAQKVLRGKTRGYRNHPQLERFKAHPYPRKAIAAYLFSVWEESCRRGYCFDRKKIGRGRTLKKILVTEGQLSYEFGWLCAKLKKRSSARYRNIVSQKQDKIRSHPLFRIVRGPVESWEKSERKS
ncbi:MAG TPA: pyrimidine dimer DNA glycosylase/endonuclease V [Candidatus Omnitrophota bacterium]|nr:pyrimidine dimer DNA glycosylase/endonuclease V [Candidatus Omnitrophota bacterium]HPS36334.1 pyrimidine dimer DNA glycosylase/endonuclease V [Candidatus Omnitrophota bacterium]